MRIEIVTPAKQGSLSGNRATAKRWAAFLRELGHEVVISVQWDETPCDLMIALHAWRSADTIRRFKEKHPQKPLIVAMTGTDLYRFIHTHPEPTLASVHLADQLVVLHDKAYLALPQEVRHKIHVIYQSAIPLPPGLKHSKRSQRNFDVCVVGHLRDEKDPLRAAYAVRELPRSSRIRVKAYGKAHDEEWAEKAREEMRINPRYRWFGEVKHWKIRQAYARCHVMVLSSVMEGGANVISEATVAGLPVIASDIDGSVGLLGDDYAGYYPVRDTGALREMLLRAESDPEFLELLRRQGEQRARLFLPEAEGRRWHELLEFMGL